MASKTTIVTVAAVVATSVLAYAVYFDYKRRNDLEFRKKLKKEKKRVNKAAQQQQVKPAEAQPEAVSPEVLKQAVDAVKSEPPVALADRESFFMNQISMGETLAAQGPSFYVPAAIAFFRALAIYPAPAELLGIYQNTVHPPVFKIVLEMVNLDITSKVQNYFDVFPPKSMNVSISKEASKEMASAHVTMVVDKDFAAGETIYSEVPIVGVLDEDIQLAGTHCTHCFRVIPSGAAVKDEASWTTYPSVYCSESCLKASNGQSQNILFTLDNPLPEGLSPGPIPAEQVELRKQAQTAFIEGHKDSQRNIPMLTARFVARQVTAETLKLSSATSGGLGETAGEKPRDYTDAEKYDYTLADHTERFRYVEVACPEQDYKLLSTLFSTTLPGLEEFTTPKRHVEMANKMMYNAYGVCFDGGRDDRPAPKARPEDIERTRTPHGTARQVGSAIYTLSSYLTHSCVPTAYVSFPTGTNELHLIAARPLKKGDTVTIAFVDVTQHEGESAAECRMRRRVELARGWKFACGCTRCAEEASASRVAGAQVQEEEVKDGAKVDEAARNLYMNLPRAHSPTPAAPVPEVAQPEVAAAPAEVAVEIGEAEAEAEVQVEVSAEAPIAEGQEVAEVAAVVEQAVEEAVQEAVESIVEETIEEATEDAVSQAIEEAVARAVEDAIAEVADEAVVDDEAKEIIEQVAEQAAAEVVLAAAEEETVEQADDLVEEQAQEVLEVAVEEEAEVVVEALADDAAESPVANGKPIEVEVAVVTEEKVDEPQADELAVPSASA